MWQRVCQTKFHNAKELNQRIYAARLEENITDDAFGHQLPVIDDAQPMSVVNVPVSAGARELEPPPKYNCEAPCLTLPTGVAGSFHWLGVVL